MIGWLAGSSPDGCESLQDAEAEPVRPVPQCAGNEENTMDRTSHLQALEVKHAGLEEQLRQELRRPAPNDAAINQLKRQKLRIKEQITQA